MRKEWVLNIKSQCEEQNVIFHFKQWGTVGEDGIRRDCEANGHSLDGDTHRGLPDKYEEQLSLF